MAKPRRDIVNVEATPFYHCIGRCVRRAFLCGIDRYSNRNYEHRRQWVIDRLKQLTESFSIKIAAYSIMSNHYHLVVYVDENAAKNWSEDEVIQRWAIIFKSERLFRKHLKHEPLKASEKIQLLERVEVWRKRLSNLSWFMGRLNEFLARKANKEDQCKGRFWESRFVSQGLMDHQAIISCMTYVDLNPIRAKASKTLENSKFTSIQQRIQEAYQTIKAPVSNNRNTKSSRQRLPLMQLVDLESQLSSTASIPINVAQYIELADWTGRQLHCKKSGIIEDHIPKIIEQMGLDEKQWIFLSRHFRGKKAYALHSEALLSERYDKQDIAC